MKLDFSRPILFWPTAVLLLFVVLVGPLVAAYSPSFAKFYGAFMLFFLSLAIVACLEGLRRMIKNNARDGPSR